MSNGNNAIRKLHDVFGSNLSSDTARHGMTNLELEALSKSRKFENGKSPWAAWESERTSFGKTFRRWAVYPAFLPLFFSSDHYVDMSTASRSNETNPSFKLYFSWNKIKVDKLKEHDHVNAIHIPHPWTKWRISRRRDDINAAGTVFFWPHSHGSLNTHVDSDRVRSELLALPPRYHPISIMMSAHDINAKKHLQVRELGFPIVTAGSLNSQKFIDRFYGLVKEFKYGAGNYHGSHVYYCLDFGMPFLILADGSLKLEALDGIDVPAGFFDGVSVDYPDLKERKIYQEWFNSLKLQNYEVSLSQMEFVKEQLGYAAETSRLRFALLVWFQFFKHIHLVPGLWWRALRG